MESGNNEALHNRQGTAFFFINISMEWVPLVATHWQRTEPNMASAREEENTYFTTSQPWVPAILSILPCPHLEPSVVEDSLVIARQQSTQREEKQECHAHHHSYTHDGEIIIIIIHNINNNNNNNSSKNNTLMIIIPASEN